MYVNTPFPNIVYALDLNDDGRVIWKYEPRQDPVGHPGDVLRYRQSRRRLWQRQDLPVSGGHDPGGARRRHRPGRLAGQERRSEHRRDRHQRAGDLQEPGVRRHFRRRVRRARQPDRLRHRDRRARLARLLDRARRRDVDGSARTPRISASRSARTAASTPGKAISGRSAAAPPGAGTRSIPS